MKPTDYSLAKAKNIEDLLKKLRTFAQMNENIVQRVLSEEHLFLLQDVKHQGRFQFKIVKPPPGDNNLLYEIIHKPHLNGNPNTEKLSEHADSIINRLRGWCSVLNEYSNISFEEENAFEAASAEEYFDEFKTNEADADTTVFPEDAQLRLYKLLDAFANKIEEADYLTPADVEAFLFKISEIQSTLQRRSKTSVVYELSKLFANIKNRAPKLRMEVLDVGKKEVIKQVLYGIWDAGENLFIEATS